MGGSPFYEVISQKIFFFRIDGFPYQWQCQCHYGTVCVRAAYNFPILTQRPSPTQESPTRLTRRGMPPTTFQGSSPRRPTTDLFTRILGSSSSQSKASSQAQVSQPRRGGAGPNTLLPVCQEEKAIRWRSLSHSHI